MLYTSEEIVQATEEERNVMIQRYLYKYFNQKREFHKFKAHEKDFIFGCMDVIYDDNGRYVFNLYNEVEAQEYLFYKIILTYGEGVDDFKGSFVGPYGKIDQLQVHKDKDFFNRYLPKWRKEIDLQKGPYLTVIAPLLNKKLVELKASCINDEEYHSREIYCYSVFFYTYYRARLFFDEKEKKCLIFNVGKYYFVENIYTFSHIFTRHYVPSLNRGLLNTINDNIPFIKIYSFLEDIKDLIILYFHISPFLSERTEYLLFKFEGIRYIIWIKYKRLDELSKEEGFEVRTLYKCEKENDIALYENTIDVEIQEGLVCCIPQIEVRET